MKDLLSHRELVNELVKREIKARYKQSLLGYAWVLFVPLVNLVVLTVVFSFFLRIDTGDIPYSIFLFTGLVPWTLTASAITVATSSLIANSSLITKIYLPREVFPLASILSKTLDFFLTFVILLFLIIFSGVGLKVTILFVPIVFIFHFLLVVGVSLILSALNVFYRDVENVISVLLMIWMYLTPVVYPISYVPENLLPVYYLNPMVGIIQAYRNLLLYGDISLRPEFIYSVVFSIAIFIIGYKFFRSKSKYFADVV